MAATRIHSVEHLLQLQGDGAVLPHEAGDAQGALGLGAFEDGAALPQGQIGLQIGQAGGQVLEGDIRLGLNQLVEGVQGIRCLLYTSDAADE